jgi:hypothetical protein
MERVLVEQGEPAGELRINSRPWSRITLDGQDLGAVPIEATVSPGEHVVVFSCDRCSPPQTRSETVEVEAGSSTKLILLLD